MKLILFLLLCWNVAGATNLLPVVNVSRLIAAIAAVETGNDDQAIGAAGERTRYQISRAVWEKYSDVPFVRAHQYPGDARKVARAYVAEIQKRTGRRTSVYHIALAWNAGPNRHVYTRHSHDYARRVMNIYEEGTK